MSDFFEHFRWFVLQSFVNWCAGLWFAAVTGEGWQRLGCIYSIQWRGTFTAQETVGDKTAMSRSRPRAQG